MDDFNLRMQQMHLHEQPEDRYRLTPKEALHELTQRVPNEDLRNALREEIKILAGDYDRLISMLQQRSEVLEQEYEHLRATEENYQNRYEKAVREMQFFKKKYEKAAEINKQYATINGNRQRSHSIESNISGLDSVHSRQNLNHSQYNGMPTSPPPSSVSGSELSTPYYNMPPPPIPPPTMENGKGIRYISRSSSSSTSSSGTPTPYWTNGVAHLPEHTPLPPIPHIRKNSTAAPSVYSAHSNHSAHSGGAESQITDPQGRFLHARKESWQSQPSSVLGAPIPSSTLSSNAIAAAKAASNSHQSADSMIQQRKVDPLSFGGSDPLWETIAKNQTTDSSIEKMIRYEHMFFFFFLHYI
jgi:hypothetical protein